MSATHSIDAALRKGTRFIVKQQQTDGGFVSESSPSKAPWKAQYQYHTTFVPALMLASLSQLEDKSVQPVRHNLARFLRAQKSPNWSFNYWAVSAAERKTFPYPDDLDDTFCALIALHEYDASSLDEKALANIVKLLLATESQVGGPYRTWLVAPDNDPVWQDVDLAVNANIAYFVSQVSNPLPNLEHMFEKHIKNGRFTSPYYPSPSPIWYYLARACPAKLHPALSKAIEQHWRSQKHPTVLDTALALSALCRLAPDSPLYPKLAKALLASQQADGSWPAAAFCIDPTRQKQRHYHGSAALTTSFALEALARYQKLRKAPAKAAVSTPNDQFAEQLQQKIMQHANQHLASLGSSVQPQLQRMLKQLVASDNNHEITLLPYFFAQSLVKHPDHQANEQLYVHLGLANLYGWIAYTIYDDFLDDEGQPALLSAANVALRQSLLHFQQALPQSTEFQHLVEQTFNTIDDANTWEVTHCRFRVEKQNLQLAPLPRFGRRQKLAERSLGHGLTPQGILVAQGVALDDPSAQAINRAFQQYLIARQLNDDAHDWKEDVQKGHITYVVATILGELKLSGNQPLAKLLPEMERQFWNHTLPAICATMQQHTARGQRLLHDNPHVVPANLLSTLLNKTAKSVGETLATQKQATNFLQSYRSKKSKS